MVVVVVVVVFIVAVFPIFFVRLSSRKIGIWCGVKRSFYKNLIDKNDESLFLCGRNTSSAADFYNRHQKFDDN